MPRSLLIAAALLAAGCTPDALPDPDAPGAVVLRQRCASCHRLYVPALMTSAMWKVQVDRMRGEFARHGLPWLTPQDERTLLDYLDQHAGTS